MTSAEPEDNTGGSAAQATDVGETPFVGVEEPEGYLYHYTSAAGLIGIVDSRRNEVVSRKLTFFASDLLLMNDITELAFGLGIVREHVERLAQSDHSVGPISDWLSRADKYLNAPTLDALRQEPRACICAASFTTSDDLLSQWVTYGAGGGFAIGLDSRVLQRSEYIGHNVRTTESRAFQSALKRVRYGDEARDKINETPLFTAAGASALPLLTILQSVVSGLDAIADWSKDPLKRKPANVVEHAGAALAIGFATQCKHVAFAAEKEWRLLVGGDSPGDLAKLLSGHYPPNFRTSGTRLLPYRPITVSAREDQQVIRDLVVGPAPDQVQHVHAAQQLLIANGHDPSVVRASPIPYRGW
ncbi:hypothetical protein NJBCHELONAE_31260 [Mycobacteroides chelonae]|uniref:DUF2971 domain-containing protein n=1 Tax=Mycobacteroides chelonae TaxID=1774 RepID=UPI0021DF034B|nr:DUF2971 domain-containing protein [Mycobacteroides chelonae]GLE57817.1 hypothetical protein NJBCHELONAE_31260 [Mycobacteroides chelonae]